MKVVGGGGGRLPGKCVWKTFQAHGRTEGPTAKNIEKLLIEIAVFYNI